MLTVDFDRFLVREGDTLLDLGCGQGRHTFEALRRGAEVTAVDMNAEDLADVEAMVNAMVDAGEIKPQDGSVTRRADALALPFADGTFDRVIAAEVLEHIADDRGAIAELVRVAKPGGFVAVTVPRYGPERVCWMLSREYHEVEGGHVRIYRGSELQSRLEAAGLEYTGHHHAHALHAPYWWLKCAVGVNRDTAATRAYHRLLVWDLMKRPVLTTTAERALNPVLGKSLVLYFRKPVAAP
jgi:SAM-dependent methyltransferase